MEKYGALEDLTADQIEGVVDVPLPVNFQDIFDPHICYEFCQTIWAIKWRGDGRFVEKGDGMLWRIDPEEGTVR